MVLPHGRDRADNVARVLARGVSGAVNRTARAAAIADAVHRVLQDPSYGADAHRLGRSVRRGADSGALVRELEDLPGGRVPHPGPA